MVPGVPSRVVLVESVVLREVLVVPEVPTQVELGGPLEGPVVQAVIQVGPVACLHHRFRQSFQFLRPNAWDGTMTFLKRV